jgi:tetratricopeptide (TPR) repeat protein
MSNAAKLKKRAVEFEQKKQLDKALALYIQFLQESDTAIDDIDIPLYNRVGDLLLRTGNASDALNYYDKAVDLYADRGFLNNAIALCNKVLRQSPGRASIYYKLGKISATKGFKSDAKKNFLEYADRMQKAGQIDEAFRALKEFADLCPDQDDIRLMLAEQLTKVNRQDEAMEQLQKLHDKLDSEGRTAEVRATVDRMKSIDPEAVPQVSGSHRPQKSQDLIFLDTSFEQKSRQRKADSAPPPLPPAPGRQVSDPNLVASTVGHQAEVPVSSMPNVGVVDAMLDADAPNDPVAAPGDLPLLAVDGDLDVFPSAFDVEAQVVSDESVPLGAPIDLDVPSDVPLPPAGTAAGTESPAMASLALDVDTVQDPPPVDLIPPRPVYGSGPSLGVDYASDLAEALTLPSDDAGLFDFRLPPRSDDFASTSAEPLMSLDPDVAFPSFDLDATLLPTADEVESGASLAAALVDDITLGSGLSELDLMAGAAVDEEVPGGATDTTFITDDAGMLGAHVNVEDGAALPVDVDWPSSHTPPTPPSDGLDTLELADEPLDTVPNVVTATPGALDEEALRRAIEDDHPTPAIAADPIPYTRVDASAHADALADVNDRGRDAERETATAPADVHADASATGTRATPVTDAPVAADSDTAAERLAGWEVQRTHAERLLERGDRASGVRELEDVAAELERIGDLERALAIVDELIRLSPESVRHHQKRVELAFRSNDRVKLIDAYLELGDALFRSGEERKARVVYQRVLELAPDDPRAQAAVDSVASVSPAAGSGAITADSPSATPRESRPAVSPARPRDTHVPYQSGPNHTSRPAGGVTAPPAARKPSPLDRSIAAHGEFVDLGEWLRAGENPKSTRMVTEEKPPTGDEQADFQEMLKRFKQGIAENVEEEDYESHYDLGVAYKEMGLMDEAVAEFQKALRGTSHRVRTYEALGQCFLEKERYQVAASVLSRAIALGEGDDHHLVGVLYLLGQATEALNKPGAALDYYQRVFAVDIEFRDVAERISEIERKAT